MTTLTWCKVDSPLGNLVLAATAQGLCYLGFAQEHTLEDLQTWLRRFYREVNLKHQESELTSYVTQLSEYFLGKRKRFDFPLHLLGTDFQKSVWRALSRIPYGQVRSYKQIAEAIGKPKAVRAVGYANKCNPMAIVIPCHRVIGSDGKLVGYSSGLDKKRKLLQIEGYLA